MSALEMVDESLGSGNTFVTGREDGGDGLLFWERWEREFEL
jgi:hypothetical protein